MKITNYKLKDFLTLENEEEVNQHLLILESLNPLPEITNPLYRWWKIGKWKQPNTIKVKNVMECTFGQVEELRQLMNDGNVDSIIEAISIVTNTEKKAIYHFTITDFYSIIKSITNDLLMMGNMEYNELHQENDDPHIELVRAGERMEKFGTLNTINSLAGDDITKWEQVENMPYMVVFTKLRMDKEKAAIQKELNDLQKKKQG